MNIKHQVSVPNIETADLKCLSSLKEKTLYSGLMIYHMNSKVPRSSTCKVKLTHAHDPSLLNRMCKKLCETRPLGMCALWPWPWRYDLGSWTTIVRNIIQIQLGSEELRPGHRFLVCTHCDLGLGGMTLGQGRDTSLSHGKQLCQMLCRSNTAVRGYGPDTDFWYVCTVTLTLEICPWFKVMTHP